MRKGLLLIVLGLGLLVAYSYVASNNDLETLVVYSSRKSHLIQPIFDAYTKKTGTKITYITGKDGPLIERMIAEGDKTSADILMTVDAGNLWYAAQSGILKPIQSAILEKNIPPHLRDVKGHWFGLSKRIRAIVYNPSRIKARDLSTYEDLAYPKWKGRLCLRTSKKVYNQSLVAMMINRLGESKALSVVSGWVKNLAVKPFSSDTKAIKAVMAGRCDVTIVNSYYFGRLLKKSLEDGTDLGANIFWPNQKYYGVHVNVSGAGISLHSNKTDQARQFLEWLSGDAQSLFASLNLEYPVNLTHPVGEILIHWGKFKEDQASLSIVGQLQPRAVQLMNQAGYK